MIVEEVPFARHRARFTRDFDDLIAWLAQRCDDTAINQLCRINWRTVCAVIERVVAEIGVDEITCAPPGAGSPCGDERAPPSVVAAAGWS